MALLLGGGVFALARYNATPGISATPDPLSPSSLGADATGKMSLVMFVHPKCPCSTASLEELSQLMATYRSRLSASVVMFRPEEQGDDWAHTSTCVSAHSIPGVEVISDTGALLAKKYGAKTSGQVFLYDGNGRLLFEGGITGSRGHVGDNDGLEAVTKLILGEMPPQASQVHAPVFGCAIYSGSSDPTNLQSTKVGP